MDFPSSPTLNQTYTFNGKTWKWNGEGWERVITDPMASYTAADVLAKLLTVDGAGSSLDADTVDGYHGAQLLDLANATGNLAFAQGGHGLPTLTTGNFIYASGTNTLGQRTPAQVLGDIGALSASSYSASDVLAKLLTVDGAGSGVDADKLDGQDGSYYLPVSSYSASDVLAKLLTVDGSGSGLDADLLDGQHGSYYAAGTHKYHTFNGGEYYYDDYNQGRYLRLFTQNASSDISRFCAISAVEYWDGSAWQSWVGGDTTIQLMLDGREDTTAAIDHTHRKFRFVVNKITGYPTTTLVVLQTTWTAIAYPGIEVTIENQVTGVWTTKDTCTFTAANSGNNWGLHAKVVTGIHDGQTQSRITVDITDWTDSGSYTAVPIRRFMMLSNYQAGDLAPFTWDYNKVLRFSATPTVSGNTIWHAGNDGTGSTLDADLLDGQQGSYYLDAANLTGTINAARSWALTGDVTSPAGSSATTIGTNKVTLAMMAQVATGTFLGRTTAATGNVEAMTAAQAKTLLALSKSDVGLSVVENTALSTWAGSTNITTLGTVATGTWNATAISIAKGGTGATTATAAFDALAPTTTLGDITYFSTTSTRLPGNTTTTKKFLTQTGTGTVSAAPSWGTIVAADVSGLGTLATQNGTFSGTSSGTNTGDQTITLTGDVSGSGTGSFAATIANGAVTLAKMANIATGTLIGRSTAATGVPETITIGSGLSLSGGVLSSTAGGGSVTSVSVVTANGVSGSVATATTTPAITLTLGAITPTSVAATGTVTGSNLSGNNTGDQTITLTGDVTGSGTGSFAATIGANKVTLAQMAQVSTGTFLGRTTAATGNVEAMTAAQAKTLLALSKSDVGLSAVENTALSTWVGSANITTVGTLTAGSIPATLLTGTIAAARMPALTGDVTTTAGAVATTIANAAVSLAKMANLAANSIIGNNTGVAATPIALTGAQVKTLLALVKADVGLSNVENTALSTWAGSTNITTLGTVTVGTWNGSVVAPAYLGTGTRDGTKFLRDDGTWQAASGGGSYLPLSGGTLTGNLAFNASTPEIAMLSPTGVHGYDILSNVSDTTDAGLLFRNWNGSAYDTVATLTTYGLLISPPSTSQYPLRITGAFTGNGRVISVENTTTDTTNSYILTKYLAGATAGQGQMGQIASEYTAAAVLTGRTILENVSGTGVLITALVAGTDIQFAGGSTRTILAKIDSAGSIYSNGVAFYGDSKECIKFSDSWLRLNDAGDFTSGTYFGTGIVRTDGQFQVGASGSVFKASSAGVTSNGELLGPEYSRWVTLAGNVTLTAAHANTTFYNNTTTSRTLTNSATDLPEGTMFQCMCYSTGTIVLSGGTSRIFWFKGDGAQPVAGNRTISRGGWASVVVNSNGQWFVTGSGIS